MEDAELLLIDGIHWLRLGIESIGAIIVAVGVLVALSVIVREAFSRTHANFTRVRISLARYLALALEFQLAADILSTAVAPTWDQIGQLAAIAVIRTGLNYFLMREMKQESAEIEEESIGEERPVSAS